MITLLPQRDRILVVQLITCEQEQTCYGIIYKRNACSAFCISDMRERRKLFSRSRTVPNYIEYSNYIIFR